jgi:hypothetical protein
MIADPKTKNRIVKTVVKILYFCAVFYAGGLFFSIQYQLGPKDEHPFPLPGLKQLIRQPVLACGSPPWTGISTFNEGMRVRCAEVPTLERQALAGSGDAAMKLAEFFAGVQGDNDDANFWWTIAAEDGDPRGMDWIALTDAKSSEFVKIRARFWLEREATSENPAARNAAAEHLKRLDK